MSRNNRSSRRWVQTRLQDMNGLLLLLCVNFCITAAELETQTSGRTVG